MSDDNQQQQNDNQQQQQQNNQTQTQAPKPEGKVWTDEYVSGLRAEAKENRLSGKKFETQLRTLLGLKPDDELSDSLISTHQKTQQKAVSDALTTANNRLLTAEIKSLTGYDAKLVERLLDRSKVTIEEDGTVKGLTEAIAALEVEFPAIKSGSTAAGGAVNPGAAGAKTEIQQLQEEYDKATSNAQRISIKNRIFVLQTKT